MRTSVIKKEHLNREISAEQAANRKSLLKALAYYDIFHYPLTKDEIRQFMDRDISAESLEISLDQLQESGVIYHYGDFYSLQANPLLAHRRKQGNARAGKLLIRARKNGRFLSKFPFVKTVAVSGSLSKNFADDKADIDFFIITKSNRLWIARTIMHLFKKLTFLAGKQHGFCMNYFIDESALELSDKNIFTAIEIKTLVPVYGQETLNHFFMANNWSDNFLPVCNYREPVKTETRRSWLRKVIESFFNSNKGERLDNFLLEKTSHRWKRKEEKGKRNDKGQMMGLVTGKHFARSNPGAFQEKVLAMYQEKLLGLEQYY
jgi:hypothetical protein